MPLKELPEDMPNAKTMLIAFLVSAERTSGSLPKAELLPMIEQNPDINMNYASCWSDLEIAQKTKGKGRIDVEGRLSNLDKQGPNAIKAQQYAGQDVCCRQAFR